MGTDKPAEQPVSKSEEITSKVDDKLDLHPAALSTREAINRIITHPEQIIDPFNEIGLTLSEQTNFLYRPVNITKDNIKDHEDDIDYISEIYKLIKIDSLKKLYLYGEIGGHFDTLTDEEVKENIEKHDTIMSAVYKGFEMKTFISWKTDFSPDFLETFSPHNFQFKTPEDKIHLENAFKKNEVVYLDEIGSLNDDFATLMSLLQLGMTAITLNKKYVLLQIFEVSYLSPENEPVNQSNKSLRLTHLFNMTASFGKVKKPVKKEIEGKKVIINKSFYLLPINPNIYRITDLLVGYIEQKNKKN